MKKVTVIFLTLSILISTLFPTWAFANVEKDASVQTKKVVIVHQKEKKESIFSKAVNSFKNFVFKVNWTVGYYALVTVGLIGLFGKLGVFESDKVYSDLKNKSFIDFSSSIWSNVKSIPECSNLIYNKLKNSANNSDSDPIKSLCSKKDKNSVEEFASSILNSINTINDGQENHSQKISNVLRNLSNTEKTTVKAWDYLRTHVALLWVSSLTGSAIGTLGSIIGAANLGWLYGIIMIPYLWSFKDDNVGNLEVLANGLDYFENLLPKNQTQNLFNKVNKFFKKA